MEIINAEPRNIHFLNDNIMNRKAVVFFVAPWCGHCQRLEPTINNIMGRFKNKSYPGVIARVQEKEIPKVKCDNDIQGFPTIRVLKPGGKKLHDYEGSRDEDSLNDFLTKIFEENKRMSDNIIPLKVSKINLNSKQKNNKAKKQTKKQTKNKNVYSELLKKEAKLLKKKNKNSNKKQKKQKKKTIKKQSGGSKKKKTKTKKKTNKKSKKKSKKIKK